MEMDNKKILQLAKTIVDECLRPVENNAFKNISLKKILFQGDSITDAGRKRKFARCAEQTILGHGYVNMLSESFKNDVRLKNIEIINRGISGNKSDDLLKRWDKDCLDIKPDMVSILIGVNDYWHQKRKANEEVCRKFYEHYKTLLTKTSMVLPNTQIVLCEPFVLPDNEVVTDDWLEPFKGLQDSAKQLSEEYQTLWVPLQTVFNCASTLAPSEIWLHDGVHPTDMGSHLIANAWKRSLGLA